MRLLMQVCQKLTKRGLSDIFEVEALTLYDAILQLEKLSGVEVDGNGTYADYVINTYRNNHDTTA